MNDLNVKTITDPEVIRVLLPVFLAEMEKEGTIPPFSDPFAVFDTRRALEVWTESEREMTATEAWEAARAERKAWREVTSH